MMLKSLRLKNILSFSDTEVALRPLNILIGPNASGKSNLIETLGVLQAAPRDLAAFFRTNGPVSDWIWKGGAERGEERIAEISAVVDNPDGERHAEKSLAYAIQFGETNGRLHVVSEKLESMVPYESPEAQPHSYLSVENGHGQVLHPIRLPSPAGDTVSVMRLRPNDFDPTKSALSEIRGNDNFPVLTRTARRFSSMRIYKTWEVGRNSPVRRPQATDGEVDFLQEDLGNLALMINNDFQGRQAGALMDEYLNRFYEGYSQIHSRVFGGLIQLTVNESGMSAPIPATRLSDGTLRFIALLTALCHPNPPDLVCIEEPELALHPDAMPILADLLESASERTQIIATTHSPDLVDQFTSNPDTVVVCERGFDGDTQLKRLSEDELGDWLEAYRLAELWKKGVIGGNRW